MIQALLSSLKTAHRSNLYPRLNKIEQIARSFSVTKPTNLKLVQFIYRHGDPRDIRLGYMTEQCFIVDVNKACPDISSTLLDVLKYDQLYLVHRLASLPPRSTTCMCCVSLKAPILGVDKVLCVGLNYKDHCRERNLKEPPIPMIFNKFPSTLIGPSEVIRLRTHLTQQVDWEVELCIVIGKEARDVPASQAYQYVMGCTVAQDISARDWQGDRNAGQYLLGKSMDAFCPIGPCITTLDEIYNPQNLDILCSVNGVVKQWSSTNQHIHKIPQIIERLSAVMTLLPGDLILTGTPGGVGQNRCPPEFLKPGDILCSQIENIGVLITRLAHYDRNC